MSDDRTDDDRTDRLGSLAQSARRSSLSSARKILIVVGVLNLLLNGAMFAFAESFVDGQIEKEKRKAGPGVVFDEVALKEARDTEVRVQKLVAGGFAVVGLVFIGLGIAVYKAPVVCTVLGMVIYLAGWLLTVVGAALGGDPEDAGKALMSGIIIRVIILIALAKAIQAAVAYQREERELRAAGEAY